MQLIDNWCKGNRNFFTGRSLYKTFGTDDDLKRLFDCGPTEENKKRLVIELEKLQSKTVQVKPVQKAIAIIEDGFDEVSNSLNNEWKKLYAEMKLYQTKLDLYGDSNSQSSINACFEICKTIKEKEQLMMRAVERFDYYKIHKRLPDAEEKEVKIPTDPLKLSRYIENVAKYIRRYRHSENPDHQQKYIDYKNLYFKATGKEYEHKN
jgi:hypothetical protein